MRYIIKICAVIILFTGCKSHKEDSNMIDMLSCLENDVYNNIDSLGYDISYVALETNDSLLLGGNLIIKYMDSENIIVESDRSLYRFDKDGRFLNRIGRQGQGPGEYIAPGRVSFDPITGRLYLFTNKVLQNWSVDGQYIGSVYLPDNKTLHSASVMMNDTLFLVRRSYGSKGELIQTIQWCDPTGKIIAENEMLRDSTEMQIAMYASPEHYRVGNAEYYRDEWDNKLYKIEYPEISECRIFDFGRYNCNRSVYQSVDKMERRGDVNVVIQQCIIANGSVWMKCLLDKRYNYVLIDRSGECLFHSVGVEDYSDPMGVAVAENSSLCFWPSYIDDISRLSCVMYPGDMDDETLEWVSKKLDVAITSDDNPIIAILK